jgi:hypothetical protein
VKSFNRGSFTTEATLITTLILIVLLMLIQFYLEHFLVQYTRAAQVLGDYEIYDCHKGLYFNQYTYRGGLTYKEAHYSIETYNERLNYRFLMHSYLLLDEIGEGAWHGIKTFNQ